MRKIIVFVLLYSILQTLGAESPAEDRTVDITKSLTLQVSTLPEMKLGFTAHFIFPFLQRDCPLRKDNNIDLALTAEVSPVSLNGIAEAVWTPIAFFQLSAGGRIGSGWNIRMFGADVYGIGVTRADANGRQEVSGSAFDGLLWKAQMGAAIQADLAAFFPGDWRHVVMRSYHEINYRGYSRAKEHESWYYENDSAESCNGGNYYGNLLIGYQMPIFFNLAALLAEWNLYLYDTPERSRWGDERMQWVFSGILGFSVTKWFDITLITQFRTCRNFIEPDWEDLYYRNRTMKSSKPLRLEFYRVAAAFTFKL